ncbi:MAG TPA: hypothetical protein VMR54_02965 [Thermoanaerobaculia bacterium]|nr:hypothetical protein [Thermoanaerobaculia bacterium]
MNRLSPLAMGLLAASAGLASPTATPTPTAARLSGGFGRSPLTPAATPPAGQSLADVVRAASRTKQGKETPRPGVAITNESLVKDPNRGRLTTWQATPRPAGRAAAAAATPAPERTAAAPSPSPSPQESSEEDKWRELARVTREKVEEAKTRVSRLESEARKLENDFYAWDDGQYRDNVIKPAWDKKREELETAREELETAEKALADLPEKARKAGALPGWIRE